MNTDTNEAIRRIYEPISKNIMGLQEVMRQFIDSFEGLSVSEVYQYFFERQGKFLRPALFFLAAGIITNESIDEDDQEAYQLALVLELLHTASLIHDDVLDGDEERRGQQVLNKKYGNSIAILAGDTLFSKAYSIVSSKFDKVYVCKISDLSYAMCLAEVEQAMGISNKKKYLDVIKGKTAIFTKTCCELGAMYVGGTDEDVEKLGQIGLDLGIAYQLYDDYKDKDSNMIGYGSINDVAFYIKRVKGTLETFKSSPYSISMLQLLELIESRLQ